MSAHDILALCACSACPSMLLEMDQLYDLLKQRMAENRDKILQDRMATREEERRAHIVRLAAWDQNRVGEKPKLVLTSVGFSRKDSAAIIVPAADNAFSQVYLNRAVYKVRVYLHILRCSVWVSTRSTTLLAETLPPPPPRRQPAVCWCFHVAVRVAPRLRLPELLLLPAAAISPARRS